MVAQLFFGTPGARGVTNSVLVVRLVRLVAQTDMFFRVWLSTLTPKETDTHLRCADGRGSFNWRFKFDLELPLESEGLRELHVQCWDLGFPHNNFVGDTLIELSAAYQRAYKSVSSCAVVCRRAVDR